MPVRRLTVNGDLGVEHRTRRRKLGGRANPRLFLDSRCLAGSLPQVIQVCPSHFSKANDLNLLETWRIGQKGSLDTHPVRHATNGETGAGTGIAIADHGALEDLDPLAVSLDDLGAHPH